MQNKFLRTLILSICSVLLIQTTLFSPLLAGLGDDDLLEKLIVDRARYIRHADDAAACMPCQLDRQIAALRSARTENVPRELEIEKMRLELELLRARLGGAAAQSSSSAAQPAVASAAAPTSLALPVPAIAQGHEADFQRFLGLQLVYRPHGDGNDGGKVVLPVRDLIDPLNGVFDLSQCGDAGEFLQVATGFRRGRMASNGKVEIWLTPRFFASKLEEYANCHAAAIRSQWDAPFGIFCYNDTHDHDCHNFRVKSGEVVRRRNLYDINTLCNIKRVPPHGPDHWMRRMKQFSLEF